MDVGSSDAACNLFDKPKALPTHKSERWAGEARGLSAVLLVTH